MYSLALILSVVSVSRMAQWPKRENPGLARTPAGKPDLSRPHPVE